MADETKKYAGVVYDYLSDTSQLAFYALVKLHEAGYTPIPVFQKLEVIEGHDIEDSPDWYIWQTVKATNRFPACTVWMEIYTGPNSRPRVEWILIWRPVPDYERERSGIEDVIGKVYLLAEHAIPPVLRELPNPDHTPSAAGAQWVKLLSDNHVVRDQLQTLIESPLFRSMEDYRELNVYAIMQALKEKEHHSFAEETAARMHGKGFIIGIHRESSSIKISR